MGNSTPELVRRNWFSGDRVMAGTDLEQAGQASLGEGSNRSPGLLWPQNAGPRPQIFLLVYLSLWALLYYCGFGFPVSTPSYHGGKQIPLTSRRVHSIDGLRKAEKGWTSKAEPWEGTERALLSPCSSRRRNQGCLCSLTLRLYHTQEKHLRSSETMNLGHSSLRDSLFSQTGWETKRLVSQKAPNSSIQELPPSEMDNLPLGSNLGNLRGLIILIRLVWRQCPLSDQ